MDISNLAIRAARKPTPTPSIEEIVVGEVSGTVDAAKETATMVRDQLPVLLTRLAMAAAIIVAGFIIVRIGRFLIQHLLFRGRRKGKDGVHKRGETFRSIASSIFSYLVYFIMVGGVLWIFGVDLSAILTTAGVFSIAIGFGAQTLVKDIISGMFIWGEGNVAVGDLVTINDLTGTVESVSIRTTVMRNYNGDVYTIPNGDIRTMTNMSRGFRRAIVSIPCPYEADQARIVEILQDEMEKAGTEIEGLQDKPDIMSISAFEKHAVMVQVAAVCPVGEHWRVERELRSRIKQRFDREGIMMPHYSAHISEMDPPEEQMPRRRIRRTERQDDSFNGLSGL